MNGVKTLTVGLVIIVIGLGFLLGLDLLGNTQQRVAAANEKADLLAKNAQWAEAADAYKQTAQLLEGQGKQQQAQAAWALAADAAQQIPDVVLAESFLLRAESASPKTAGLVRRSLAELRKHGKF